MEEKVKSKETRLVLILTSISILLMGIGVYLVLNNKDEKSNLMSSAQQVTNNKGKDGVEYEDAKTTINVKESSKEAPLEIGEWGNSSKRVTENFSYEEYKKIQYIDVPTSVTKIIRGKDADEVVKKWGSANKSRGYKEAKENMEWVVIEYKVDLSNVKIKEGSDGIKISVDSSLTGPKGGTSITHNKITCIMSPHDMSEDVKAEKPGIYTGKIMATLPVGFSDYTIQLGSSYDNTNEGNKGTIAYFKGQ